MQETLFIQGGAATDALTASPTPVIIASPAPEPMRRGPRLGGKGVVPSAWRATEEPVRGSSAQNPPEDQHTDDNERT